MRTIGRASSRAHADERGQSLVEVALCLPLLLLIVIGIVDIGRVYAYKVAVTNAAREAAIYAARDPQAPADAICRRARSELGAGAAATPCSTAPITISCTRAGAACGNTTAFPAPLFQTGGGADVTITVRYDVSLLSAYLVSRAFQVNPVPVSAGAVFSGLGK